jgi:hypothetical protein
VEVKRRVKNLMTLSLSEDGIDWSFSWLEGNVEGYMVEELSTRGRILMGEAYGGP